MTNVTVHELALSSEPGRLKMGVPDWDNLGMARVVSRDGPAAGHEVAADTLDAFCRREGIDDIAVCKIDVEGHEADVLRGARRTLEAGAVRAFVFERAVTTSAAAEDEVVQLFHSNQYSVLQLHKRVLGMDAADCGCNGNHAVRGTSTLDFIALRRHTRAEELWAGLL